MKKDLINILVGGMVVLGTSGIYGYNNFYNKDDLTVQDYISKLPATAAGNLNNKYQLINSALERSKFYGRDF